jgi:uncharacterized protein YggU (UPF0235/DUF167 family)
MMAPNWARSVTLSGERRLASSPALPRVFVARERCCVAVRVSPSSPKVQLKGLYGDRLKVSLSAPPEQNRANKQLERALAEWLGLARDNALVLAGHTSRDKVVGFADMDEAELKRRLEALLLRCGQNTKESESGSQGS